MTLGKAIVGICGAICTQFNIAHAQALSLDVEIMLIPNVSGVWQTVNFLNTYSTPIVTCTYNLPSSVSNSAIVRIRNVSTTSFDVRTQHFEDSAAVTPSNIHCLIVDEGVHTLSNGQEIEAHTVLSDNTSGQAIGWSASTTENVTGLLGHTYSDLVVVGQVMSFNDNRASAFWTNNCANRATAPTPAAFCVGKHIGQINSSRTNETLGFIAMEAGSGTVNDVSYVFARGADSIRGVGNTPPFNYSVSGDFDIGIAQSGGEDGGQGGWAVLYGNDPLPNGSISLAIDEETVAGDTTRTHTTEEVFYAIFSNNQSANLIADKTSEIYSGSGTGYATPGSDVIYTIAVQSLGTSPIDSNSIFLVDNLPSEVEFFNGDIDDGGPETGPFSFDPMASGLTLTPVDIRYSDAITAPASFAACTYTPNAGYDENVRHICFNPKGRLKAGSLETNTDFEVSFRVRIK